MTMPPALTLWAASTAPAYKASKEMALTAQVIAVGRVIGAEWIIVMCAHDGELYNCGLCSTFHVFLLLCLGAHAQARCTVVCVCVSV